MNFIEINYDKKGTWRNASAKKRRRWCWLIVQPSGRERNLWLRRRFFFHSLRRAESRIIVWGVHNTNVIRFCNRGKGVYAEIASRHSHRIVKSETFKFLCCRRAAPENTPMGAYMLTRKRIPHISFIFTTCRLRVNCVRNNNSSNTREWKEEKTKRETRLYVFRRHTCKETRRLRNKKERKMFPEKSARHEKRE